MPPAPTASPSDPRLAPFLAAESDAEAEASLAALFDGDIDGVLRDAVRRAAGHSSRSRDYADDIANEVRLRLIRKLRALRRGEGDAIENLHAYVVSAATRTCYAFLREQHPERTRLRNRVRYAVSHLADTELAADAAGVWQCVTRKPIREAAARGATISFLDAPLTFLSKHRISTTSPLPSIVAAILERLDTPIAFDRLVDALAVAFGTVEVEIAAPRPDPEWMDARLADPAPNVSSTMEEREALRQIWDEIVALPPNQRTALLLNLRDPEGGAMVHVLPSTGVVTMGELAEALGMETKVLDKMWNDLPFDDLAIASRLGLTRQQVINLRKSARARLARRTKTKGKT